MALIKPKSLILPKRELFVPRDRRKLPRPAPWIWVPKRFAPQMSVAFDAKGTAINDANANTSPFTQPTSTLTPAAGATILIGAFFSAGAAVAPTSLSVPTSMTWDQGGTNQAMTLVGNKTASDNITNIYIYAVVSPTTGSGKKLSVAFTPGVLGSSASITNSLDCWTFTGSDTSSVANAIPSANVTQDASTASAAGYPSGGPFTITTVSGDAVSGACNEGTLAGGSSMVTGTFINAENGQNNNTISGYNLAVGSSTNIRFFSNGTAPFCGVVFRIVQPSSGDVLQSQAVM